MSGLSDRAKSFLNFEFKMEEYFKMVASDPYSKDSNPNGIIDMGSSTNGIVSDLIVARLASIDMNQMPISYIDTCEVQGPLRFRKVMAAFFNHYIQPTKIIEADDIFVQAGAGSIFESIGFALLDPGDAILLPQPYYYQFDHEFTRVCGATLIPFPVSMESNSSQGVCTIKREDIVLAYDGALSKGLRVKVVLLVNPNNPVGYIFDENALKLCAEFCQQHDLHLVSDEIYMHCVFGKAVFRSILSIPEVEVLTENIHVIWAFSKEFAVAGFRVGTLITKNRKLKAVINEDLNKRVSNLTLFVIESLVADFHWLDDIYYPTFLFRLKTITEYVRRQFEYVNVTCFPSHAGLFLWVNFKNYSDKCDHGDMELFNRFMGNKIYISPGIAFKEIEVGWFRVITSLPDDIIVTGINRILQVLEKL